MVQRAGSMGWVQPVAAGDPLPAPKPPSNNKNKQAGQHDSEHHHPFTPQKLPPAKTLAQGQGRKGATWFFPAAQPETPKTRFGSKKPGLGPKKPGLGRAPAGPPGGSKRGWEEVAVGSGRCGAAGLTRGHCG